jgi:hypothetical protein
LVELGKRHSHGLILEFEYITLHLQTACEPSVPSPCQDSEPLPEKAERWQNLKIVGDDCCPQSAAAWAEALKLQNGSQQTLEAHFTAILSLLDCKLFSEFAPNWLGGKFLQFLQKNTSINSNKQIYFSIVVKILRIIIVIKLQKILEKFNNL